MTTLADFVTDKDIAALNRPLGEAIGLPGRVFGSAFFALEQRDLFPRIWCPVGFASDIPEPGDAVPVNLAGWPILLVRGKDRVIRGFLNICRHRAMSIVTEKCKGHSTFTCPWHGWVYDLDGKVAGTPKIGGERANKDPNFSTDGLGLKPVRVGTWLDMLFVNIDGQAPPLDAHMRPLDDILAPYYDLSTLVRADVWSTEYPGNWKVAVETVLDEYHIPFAHQQLMTGVRQNNNVNGHLDRCYMLTSNARIYGNTRESAQAMGYQYDFPNILKPSAPEPRSHFVTIFPIGAIQTRPNHALLGLFLPDGPEKTKITFAHYYPGQSASDPALAPARQEIVESWKIVFAQDVPFADHVHRNHQVRDHAGLGTRMAPVWEECVASFYRSMIAVMQETRPAP